MGVTIDRRENAALRILVVEWNTLRLQVAELEKGRNPGDKERAERGAVMLGEIEEALTTLTGQEPSALLTVSTPQANGEAARKEWG